MKRCLLALCALVFVAAADAATPTPAQVEAWKKLFPVVSPGRSPAVYQLTTGYQSKVKLVTVATLESTVRQLLDQANKDTLAINEKLKTLPKPGPREVKRTPANAEWFDTTEQLAWLGQRLVPFLKRMGG
ncbi:MAG: hypothetical protein JNN01_24355 [Opitutaceae bacterium]|nr:hypothetical protein [Opitutaceae bacterium]